MIERIDLQLIRMIAHAKSLLERDLGLRIEDQVTMWGFSASGDFVDRFCMLHPEKVKAAVTGGCHVMLPLSEYNGENLPYPIGLYDYQKITGREFDADAFSKIDRFIFRGDRDKIGWITSNGKKTPTEDYYRLHWVPLFEKDKKRPVTVDGNITEAEEEQIRYRIFGNEASYYQHFLKTKALCENMGFKRQRYRVYHETGHQITDEINDDYEEIFGERA